MLRVNYLPNRIEGEKIVKIIRKDLFILFKKILGLLVLSLVPLVFIYILFTININIIIGDFSYPLLVLGVSAYYLFIWVFFFFSFIDYYLDIWIITNKRIIDIETALTETKLKLEKVSLSFSYLTRKVVVSPRLFCDNLDRNESEFLQEIWNFGG